VIVGIGVDIVEVARLERALKRHPALRDRLFTADELGAGPGEPRSLAARLAAKEAARKAVGLAAGRSRWRDAEVIGGRGAPPRLELRGALLDAALAAGAARWQLSLSHERAYAVAMVVIET